MTAPVPIIELAQTPELALESAAQVLRQSGVVVVPTDTVYGLAALAGDPAAEDKLFALKQRPESVPIAVLVADTAQALRLIAPPDRSARLLMQEFWPGPLTIVLPAASVLPATIGVRCPDHDFISELAAEVGPLATTSANLHGQPVCATAAEIAAVFAAPPAAILDLIIDGGRLTASASTVVACGPDEELQLLREGTIAAGQLRDALKTHHRVG